MSLLYIWAKKWNVSHAALDDLIQLLGAVPTDPDPMRGDSEQAVQARIRLEATRRGARLWRNNVGAFTTDRGDFIRFGLANDTARMNKLVKSSDLIGLRPVRITQSHVGTVIGQFVAREVKRAGWKWSGTEREQAQLKFIQLVISLGGDARFTNSEGTL